MKRQQVNILQIILLNKNKVLVLLMPWCQYGKLLVSLKNENEYEWNCWSIKYRVNVCILARNKKAQSL